MDYMHCNQNNSKQDNWWAEDYTARAGLDAAEIDGTGIKEQGKGKRWLDVEGTIKRMDKIYDASFYSWLKNEDNAALTASYLQRIANKYPLDRIINAIRWLVADWRIETTALIIRQITACWSCDSPNLCGKETGVSVFEEDMFGEGKEKKKKEGKRKEESMNVCSPQEGERRKGILVREVTKDWTCHRVAQLVSRLASVVPYQNIHQHPPLQQLRTQQEHFLRALALDWDFCRLSEFFSYVSGQLGLDYRVKVAMLQQAVKRNNNNSNRNKKKRKLPADISKDSLKQHTFTDSNIGEMASKRSRQDSNAHIVSTTNTSLLALELDPQNVVAGLSNSSNSSPNNNNSGNNNNNNSSNPSSDPNLNPSSNSNPNDITNEGGSGGTSNSRPRDSATPSRQSSSFSLGGPSDMISQSS